MRRKLLLVLLGLGSVAGFAAGVHSLGAHHEGGWGCRFREPAERLDVSRGSPVP
jgi:hypothetical protein